MSFGHGFGRFLYDDGDDDDYDDADDDDEGDDETSGLPQPKQNLPQEEESPPKLAGPKSHLTSVMINDDK